jgi:hypothetical protein
MNRKTRNVAKALVVAFAGLGLLAIVFALLGSFGPLFIVVSIIGMIAHGAYNYYEDQDDTITD